MKKISLNNTRSNTARKIDITEQDDNLKKLKSQLFEQFQKFENTKKLAELDKGFTLDDLDGDELIAEFMELKSLYITIAVLLSVVNYISWKLLIRPVGTYSKRFILKVLKAAQDKISSLRKFPLMDNKGLLLGKSGTISRLAAQIKEVVVAVEDEGAVAKVAKKAIKTVDDAASVNKRSTSGDALRIGKGLIALAGLSYWWFSGSKSDEPMLARKFTTIKQWQEEQERLMAKKRAESDQVAKEMSKKLDVDSDGNADLVDFGIDVAKDSFFLLLQLEAIYFEIFVQPYIIDQQNKGSQKALLTIIAIGAGGLGILLYDSLFKTIMNSKRIVTPQQAEKIFDNCVTKSLNSSRVTTKGKAGVDGILDDITSGMNKSVDEIFENPNQNFNLLGYVPFFRGKKFDIGAGKTKSILSEYGLDGGSVTIKAGEDALTRTGTKEIRFDLRQEIKNSLKEAATNPNTTAELEFNELVKRVGEHMTDVAKNTDTVYGADEAAATVTSLIEACYYGGGMGIDKALNRLARRSERSARRLRKNKIPEAGEDFRRSLAPQDVMARVAAREGSESVGGIVPLARSSKNEKTYVTQYDELTRELIEDLRSIDEEYQVYHYLSGLSDARNLERISDRGEDFFRTGNKTNHFMQNQKAKKEIIEKYNTKIKELNEKLKREYRKNKTGDDAAVFFETFENAGDVQKLIDDVFLDAYNDAKKAYESTLEGMLQRAKAGQNPASKSPKSRDPVVGGEDFRKDIVLDAKNTRRYQRQIDIINDAEYRLRSAEEELRNLELSYAKREKEVFIDITPDYGVDADGILSPVIPSYGGARRLPPPQQPPRGVGFEPGAFPGPDLGAITDPQLFEIQKQIDLKKLEVQDLDDALFDLSARQLDTTGTTGDLYKKYDHDDILRELEIERLNDGSYEINLPSDVDNFIPGSTTASDVQRNRVRSIVKDKIFESSPPDSMLRLSDDAEEIGRINPKTADEVTPRDVRQADTRSRFKKTKDSIAEVFVSGTAAEKFAILAGIGAASAVSVKLYDLFTEEDEQLGGDDLAGANIYNHIHDKEWRDFYVDFLTFDPSQGKVIEYNGKNIKELSSLARDNFVTIATGSALITRSSSKSTTISREIQKLKESGVRTDSEEGRNKIINSLKKAVIDEYSIARVEGSPLFDDFFAELGYEESLMNRTRKGRALLRSKSQFAEALAVSILLTVIQEEDDSIYIRVSEYLNDTDNTSNITTAEEAMKLGSTMKKKIRRRLGKIIKQSYEDNKLQEVNSKNQNILRGDYQYLSNLVKDTILEYRALDNYNQYPYNSEIGSNEEEQKDFIEDWKDFELSLVRDESRNSAIELAKILIKDLELFGDVIDLVGKNQSVGTEILKKIRIKQKESKKM